MLEIESLYFIDMRKLKELKVKIHRVLSHLPSSQKRATQNFCRNQKTITFPIRISS